VLAGVPVRGSVACPARAMDVVWLKRDVRLHDHVPLATAAASGRPFALLFLYEPDQLSHETVHGSHVAFVNEGLQELEQRLRALSGGSEADRFITTSLSEATEALEALQQRTCLKILRLLSHQETGHLVSYDRDRRVKKWCRARGIAWVQVAQSGVVRGLPPDGAPDTAAGTRAGSDWHSTWAAHLESFLQSDAAEDPFESSPGGARGALCERLVRPPAGGATEGGEVPFPSPTELSRLGHLISGQEGDRPKRQLGGESRALALLADFLQVRGERYSGSISSPNSAWTACSRLSPYLSWGQISMRTIWQNVEACRLEARGGNWKRSLQAFLVRLQWRTNYCQRFEMRYWMEKRNACRAWEHLRQGSTYVFGDLALLGSLPEEQRLLAFKEGRTGYPMVDACMRCLLETGWLNFRMRCMLVSFAIFNLWLDWRCIAGHFARCFLDYEPGIHYPQLQMQSGTTGCDLRCYSVLRQAKDQDPKGEFIRRYIPELRELPGESALEPWKIPASSQLRSVVDQYPSRIVDEAKTSKASKTIISTYQQWFQAGGGRGGEEPPPLDVLLASKASAAAAAGGGAGGGGAGRGRGTGGRGRGPAEGEGRSADIGAMLGLVPAAKRRRGGDALGDDGEGEKGAGDGEEDGEGEEAAIAAAASEAPAPPRAGVPAPLPEPVPVLAPVRRPWACPRCTLRNAAGADACEACEGPRPSAIERGCAGGSAGAASAVVFLQEALSLAQAHVVIELD